LGVVDHVERVDNTRTMVTRASIYLCWI
jgi:hypothetical protein